MVQVSTSSSAGSSKAASTLLQLLDKGSDVQLVFTAADGQTETLPAHTQILTLWSPVLAEAIMTARSSQSPCSSLHDPNLSFRSSSLIKIPMPDTCKDDWLLVMEYMYPVTPAPQPNWSVLETLLKVADKYGMSAVVQRCGDFLVKNAGSLDTMESSKHFVWKWIFAADKYRLFDAARACMSSKDTCELMRVCPKQRLHELSGDTLQHIIIAMSARMPMATPIASKGVDHCRSSSSAYISASDSAVASARALTIRARELELQLSRNSASHAMLSQPAMQNPYNYLGL